MYGASSSKAKKCKIEVSGLNLSLVGQVNRIGYSYESKSLTELQLLFVYVST